ncbi:MAG TPA: glycosyltransferase family 2 protein [Thermoanaerobaculia bacterium]|nr:glycosyltransferase family 2 protein [Thermoanaerobaculia bacterium]
MTVPYAPTVSLVLPMFNEEENIEAALLLAVEALEQYSSDYEIIVVDDASTDRSPEIVERLASENRRIQVLRHEQNRKLGGALRSGFAAASKDLVLYMDADLPSDPRELGRAIRAMNVTRADVIAGYRFDRTTEGFKRSLYSRVYNGLIGLLFGWPYRDINFAFKLMKKEVLDAVEIRSEGSLIDAEIIVKAKNLGFVVQQIGVDYFPRSRGRSSLSSPAVILKIFKELAILHSDMRNPRRKSPAREGSLAVKERTSQTAAGT